MPLTEEEQTFIPSHEQRMANYRQRVRVKLRERGVPEEDLDSRTEELMKRPSGKFSTIFE